MASTAFQSLEWAYSTCPNDTFVFGALALGILSDYKIRPPYLGDIQQLNALALQGKPDVVKISAAIYPQVQAQYELVDVGSALGIDVGPILVKRKDVSLRTELSQYRVAVPGLTTTANLLLSHFHPEVTQRAEVLFTEIPARVLAGEFAAGVLIHEGRFTYQNDGLELVEDLGQMWYARHRLPLPLGLIVVRRSLAPQLKEEIATAMRASLACAHRDPTPELWHYIATQAQISDQEIVAQHIATYVNSYTESLGAQGRWALEVLLRS